MNEGKVISIRGVVVDVSFPEDKTPKINDALVVENKKLGVLTLEVGAVLDTGLVRAVAMGNVYGLARGMKVKNTGRAIEVPVGSQTLGRIFNVLGETIDHGKKVTTAKKYPIHRQA